MSVKKFENFLSFEKRFSPHTVLAYIQDLTQLTHFLDLNYSETPLESIHHSHIRSWMVSLMENGMEPSSIHRKISSLRSYFKFLMREGLISKNPLVKIQLPKKSKRIPVFVSEKKMDELLDHQFFQEDLIGTRDRLLIELFYCSGIRLSEFLNLREQDIDFNQSQIKVLGKRNKERIIPIPTYLSQHLREYIQQRNLAFPNRDEDQATLFITDEGNSIYPKWIYRKVKQFLSLISTAQKRSPHILRHSIATHLLNRGADINAIKELLGHANLGATQVYTHNSTERLKNIYLQAHPKA